MKALIGGGQAINLSGKAVKQSLQNIAACCETIIKSEPLNATSTLDTLEVATLFKVCYENFSLSSDKMYGEVEVAGKIDLTRKTTSGKRKSEKENGPVKPKSSKRKRLAGGEVAK